MGQTPNDLERAIGLHDVVRRARCKIKCFNLTPAEAERLKTLTGQHGREELVLLGYPVHVKEEG